MSWSDASYWNEDSERFWYGYEFIGRDLEDLKELLVDKFPNNLVMQLHRFGAADGLGLKTLNSGTEVKVLTFDALGEFLDLKMPIFGQ